MAVDGTTTTASTTTNTNTQCVWLRWNQVAAPVRQSLFHFHMWCQTFMKISIITGARRLPESRGGNLSKRGSFREISPDCPIDSASVMTKRHLQVFDAHLECLELIRSSFSISSDSLFCLWIVFFFFLKLKWRKCSLSQKCWLDLDAPLDWSNFWWVLYSCYFKTFWKEKIQFIGISHLQRFISKIAGTKMKKTADWITLNHQVGAVSSVSCLFSRNITQSEK